MQQHTGLDGFLRNVLIRTLVLWILLFLSALVLVLALLGVSALGQAENTIANGQVALKALQEANLANDQYLRASSRLMRQQHEMNEGNMAAAETQGKNAKSAIDKSQVHFQAFYNQMLASRPDLRSSLDQIKTQFEAVITQGLQPLAGMLDKQDRAGYWAHMPKYLELSVAFNKQLTEIALAIESAQEASATRAAAESKRTIIAMLVVLGMCLLTAFLTDRYIVAYVRKPLHQLEDHLRRIAAGDLTGHIEVFGRNCVGLIMPSLVEMQSNLVRTVGVVRQGVDEIYTGASEIASGNHDLSNRTEQQAASLEQTASSMEELSSTVRQSAEHAAQANQMATEAGRVAERGGHAIEQVVGTMAEISNSSRRISDIVSVIDSIAFQTNILALNASVEAARAGEQGRGFAVVASEVRGLAQRSAEAAREIKALITASSNTVSEGVRLVDSTKTTMDELFRHAGAVNGLVSEIAAATREQSAGIDQVNDAVGKMDQSTQQNAALVEQTAAAAKSLESQANQLQQSISAFKLPPGFGGAAPAGRNVPLLG